MGLRLLTGALLLTLPLAAQIDLKAPLKPDVILLARVRAVASETFSRLPNYTCTLTIERLRRQARSNRFSKLDTVRLEVALVDNKEFYAWPGATQFEERNPRELVGSSAMTGSGEFAGHARAILLSSRTSVTYAGKDQRLERELHRFDFTRTRDGSNYSVRIGDIAADVGYRGSFWVDPVSMDLQRIEFTVDDIPPELPLMGSFQSIEYERRKIGDADSLLPSIAEAEMTTTLSNQTERNRTHFENCRQFAGESTISFSDPADTVAGPSQPVDLNIPAKLRISTKPTAKVDLRNAAKGDLIELATDKPATMNDKTWLPKGALIKARVMSVVCVDSPYQTCMAMLRPESVEAGNASSGIKAELESPPLNPNAGSINDRNAFRMLWSRMPAVTPDAGIVVIRGGVVPSNYNLVWRTLEIRE